MKLVSEMRTAAKRRPLRRHVQFALEAGCNIVERGRQTRSYGSDRADNGDCNQSRNQTVLNSRCARFVSDETGKKGFHGSLRLVDTLGSSTRAPFLEDNPTNGLEREPKRDVL